MHAQDDFGDECRLVLIDVTEEKKSPPRRWPWSGSSLVTLH